MKKYKQTVKVSNGTSEEFDATKLPQGSKFLWSGRVFVRTANYYMSQGMHMLGVSLNDGEWIDHSLANECSPFVGTVTITQEEE